MPVATKWLLTSLAKVFREVDTQLEAFLCWPRNALLAGCYLTPRRSNKQLHTFFFHLIRLQSCANYSIHSHHQYLVLTASSSSFPQYHPSASETFEKTAKRSYLMMPVRRREARRPTLSSPGSRVHREMAIFWKLSRPVQYTYDDDGRGEDNGNSGISTLFRLVVRLLFAFNVSRLQLSSSDAHHREYPG